MTRNLAATVAAIQNTPTCYLDMDKGRCHESLLRSYQILAFAKDWLAEGVPAHVVLDAIRFLEEQPVPDFV